MVLSDCEITRITLDVAIITPELSSNFTWSDKVLITFEKHVDKEMDTGSKNI